MFPLLSTILLAITGTFSPHVTAQQLDKPDTIQTFPVQQSPWGLVFDGANIWVVSTVTSDIVKLRASDGAFQGSFPTGEAGFYGAFDGASIWMTHYNNNTVSKLRASDGVLEGTFRVGQYPIGI